MRTLDARFPLNNKTRHDKDAYYLHLPKIMKSASFARTFSPLKSSPKVEDLSVSKIAAIIESLYKDGTYDARLNEFLEDVAPNDLILEDFKEFWRESMSHVDPEYKIDLTVRAIPGHAQKGHTVFKPESAEARGFDAIRDSYPNTSTLDVLAAIMFAKKSKLGQADDLPSNMSKFSPRYFGRRTDKSIDSFVHYVIEDFFDNPKKYVEDAYLVTPNNKPVFGLEFLRDQPVNVFEMMRSLYFSLHMDGAKRKDVQRVHGINMGVGSNHIVDKDLFAAYGFSLRGVASLEFNDELKLLEKLSHEKKMRVIQTLGVTRDSPIDPKMIDMMRKLPQFSWDLLKQTFGVKRFEEDSEAISYSNVYFRDQKGLGISDDLAILQSGFLPHTCRTKNYRPTGTELVSRVIGAFIGDHIDTIQADASHIFTGGQDELLLQYLDAKLKNAMSDPEFIDVMNINRSAKDLSFIPANVLDDFIAMGANYAHGKKGDYDVIHSSQRWFFRKIDETNAIGEYMKLVRDGISRYDLDQQPFVQTPSGSVKKDVKVTFDRIHMGPIVNEFYERSDVLNAGTRKQSDVTKYVRNRMQAPVNKRSGSKTPKRK